MNPRTVLTPAQVGAFIVSRRKELNLTQSAVATRLGLSQNRVSELESNPATLTVEQLLNILNLLGLELGIGPRPGNVQPKVEW